MINLKNDTELRMRLKKRIHTVLLLAVHTLDVNNPPTAVNLGHFAFRALVASTNNLDFIVLADRERTDVVLSPELLREVGAHQDATNARRSREVVLPVLATGRRNGWGKNQQRERAKDEREKESLWNAEQVKKDEEEIGKEGFWGEAVHTASQ